MTFVVSYFTLRAGHLILEAVRDRKDPSATVEMGQSTNIVLCMAMDALRQGN